jgi:hypothetical protein
MIRSQTMPIGSATVVASSCYGFSIHRKTGGAEFPLIGTITYQYGPQAIVVREGVWYGGTEEMLSVSLATASGTSYDYYIDSGSKAEDIAAPVPTVEDVREQLVYTSPAAYNFNADPVDVDFAPPAGLWRRLDVWSRMGQISAGQFLTVKWFPRLAGAPSDDPMNNTPLYLIGSLVAGNVRDQMIATWGQNHSEAGGAGGMLQHYSIAQHPGLPPSGVRLNLSGGAALIAGATCHLFAVWRR